MVDYKDDKVEKNEMLRRTGVLLNCERFVCDIAMSQLYILIEWTKNTENKGQGLEEKTV